MNKKRIVQLLPIALHVITFLFSTSLCAQESIADVISKAKAGDTMYAVIKQISGKVTMDTFRIVCTSSPEATLSDLEQLVQHAHVIRSEDYKRKIGIFPASLHAHPKDANSKSSEGSTGKPFPWIPVISTIGLLLCIAAFVAIRHKWIGGDRESKRALNPPARFPHIVPT